MKKVTAHDLAASSDLWEGVAGFRIGRGRVLWEEASYPTERARFVRCARLVAGPSGVKQINKYVDPETVVTLVKDSEL